MERSPYDLAAIATAAVPGLNAVQVGRLPDAPEDFDAALVVDDEGTRWRVRSPKHVQAALKLDTELRSLGGLSSGVRATLPFAVPSVAGTVRQGELKTFVYHHLQGHQLPLEELLSSPSMAHQVGMAISAIHEIDRPTVARSGLPVSTPEEFRVALLSELDQVAGSGKVPNRLLRRWENAMEDAGMWRFNAAVVHGDLHEEQIFVDQGKIVAVTGWSDLHIGDPAEDLGWLLALEQRATMERVVTAYVQRRATAADPHLLDRATLHAEFALARWLARAISRDDLERVAQAEGLLAELDANIAELGDLPIGVVEDSRPERQGSAGSAQSAASAQSTVSAQSSPSAESGQSTPSAGSAQTTASAQSPASAQSAPSAHPTPSVGSADSEPSPVIDAEDTVITPRDQLDEKLNADHADATDNVATAHRDSPSHFSDNTDGEHGANTDDDHDDSDAVITDADVDERGAADVTADEDGSEARPAGEGRAQKDSPQQ
ncbi:MAG: phosphotransferase [Galactobacter sp.]